MVMQMEQDLTPDMKMQNSFAQAASQLRVAAEVKKQRMQKYGLSDDKTTSFDLDTSTIFPKESEESKTIYQNQKLGKILKINLQRFISEMGKKL